MNKNEPFIVVIINHNLFVTLIEGISLYLCHWTVVNIVKIFVHSSNLSVSMRVFQNELILLFSPIERNVTWIHLSQRKKMSKLSNRSSYLRSFACLYLLEHFISKMTQPTTVGTLLFPHMASAHRHHIVMSFAIHVFIVNFL